MTSPLKIIECCSSRSLGGLELYFLSCCDHLSGRKPIALLSYVEEQTPIHQSLIEKKIPLSVNKGKTFVSKIPHLLHTLKAFKPHIIHTHVKSDLLLVGLCKVISRHSFKHIHTRHMNMPHKKKDPYHRFIYGQIDLMITITDKLRKDVIHNISIPPSQVKRLYNGVPGPKKGDPTTIDGLNTAKGFKVGLIARIDPKKNQHIAIAAIKLLKNKGHHIHLFLIGKSTNDEYEATLKQMIIENKLTEDIKMCGFVKQPNDLMSFFDTILLPTAEEAFGLALVEGMRAEVAVVGANGGGVPEIIEHKKTGLLFEPGNADSLAQQLEQLILKPAMKKELAENGKRMADEKFNQEAHFDELVHLFDLSINEK